MKQYLCLPEENLVINMDNLISVQIENIQCSHDAYNGWYISTCGKNGKNETIKLNEPEKTRVRFDSYMEELS